MKKLFRSTDVRRTTTLLTLALAITLSLFILPQKSVALDFSSTCPIFTTPTSGGTGGGGTGGGGTGGGGTPGAGATTLIEKACYYMKNPAVYNRENLKGVTDCYGFVVTSLRKSGVDPNALVNTRAKYAISNYYKKHPEKYTIIHPVTSTKQLKAGDMVFNVDYGSHAFIYVGPGYCGCSGGVISASIGRNAYRPMCKSWYSSMSWAVRLK